MSVHQLKDGRWIVQYRNPETRNKYKREYFGRGRAAETEARERDASLDLRGYEKRTPGPEGSPRFEELAQGYIAARISSIETTTYNVLQYKLKSLLLPEFGGIAALKITPERIDKYVATRLARGKKSNTIRRDIADIQAIMNWGASRGMISHNPLTGYKKPRSDSEIVSPPTLTEMIDIDKHAPDHLRRYLKTIFYTGCRPGTETTSLKYSSINWDNNTIRIVSARKHGLKYRDVPIFADFRKLLEDWKAEDRIKIQKAEDRKRIQGFKDSRVQAAEEKDLEGMLKDMNIINFKNGSVISLKRSWSRARIKAGITRAIRPYSYRHAFVSMLLDSGADLKSVSELVGHSNTALTLQVYQHTNRQMHKSAIEKLPKMAW